MDEIQIRKVISAFSGNINSAFMLVEGLSGELGFDLEFNFDSSTALQRFTNLVRNMIQKGIVDKPVKSGRTLILDDRSILQLLVGRKYLSAGCSMASLDGYLIGLSTESLYERLFTKQLPDVDKLARRAGDSSSSTDSDVGTSGGSYTGYYHAKVNPHLTIQFKAGKFSPDEMDEMVILLKSHLSKDRGNVERDGGDDDVNEGGK